MNSIINPISNESLIELESSISKFVTQWNSIERLVGCVAAPDGTGIPDDIFAIDYVIYEGMNSVFFPSREALIRTGSLLLGKYLIQFAEFEWCEISTFTGKSIGLTHPESHQIIPLFELSLYKYTGRPQFGTFETLFFDVIFSTADAENCHPLNYVTLQLFENEKSFEEKFGYNIPESIMELYEVYALADEEFTLRQIGLEGIDLCNKQDWVNLEKIIKSLDYIYRKIYGKDWKERLKKQQS